MRISIDDVRSKRTLTTQSAQTWAEDFLLHNSHVGGDIREDRRLDEIPLGSTLLAASLKRRAFLLTGVYE